MSYDIELDELTHQKPFKNYSVTPDDYISWQFFFKKKIIDLGAEELTPRGPWFDSQNSQNSSQFPVTPIQGIQNPLLASLGTVCTDIHVG